MSSADIEYKLGLLSVSYMPNPLLCVKPCTAVHGPCISPAAKPSLLSYCRDATEHQTHFAWLPRAIHRSNADLL